MLYCFHNMFRLQKHVFDAWIILGVGRLFLGRGRVIILVRSGLCTHREPREHHGNNGHTCAESPCSGHPQHSSRALARSYRNPPAKHSSRALARSTLSKPSHGELWQSPRKEHSAEAPQRSPLAEPSQGALCRSPPTCKPGRVPLPVGSSAAG